MIDSCSPKLASIVNKAGNIVNASIKSAETAVRSRAQDMMHSSCPGFGLCGDLVDADGPDAWPITALSVRLTTLLLKDYLQSVHKLY